MVAKRLQSTDLTLIERARLVQQQIRQILVMDPRCRHDLGGVLAIQKPSVACTAMLMIRLPPGEPAIRTRSGVSMNIGVAREHALARRNGVGRIAHEPVPVGYARA